MGLAWRTIDLFLPATGARPFVARAAATGWPTQRCDALAFVVAGRST